MIYIPIEWLADENNLDAVYEILDSTFFTDLNLVERIDDAVRRLRGLGENGIADKLQNGEIVLPS